MLSKEELDNLYQIISDDTKTFDQIGNSFQKAFSKQDQFKVGLTVWFLLKDDLLCSSQRIASFYLYYEMYKTESISNTPFIPIILETLESTESNAEKKFLLDFINIGQIKNNKISVKNYLEENKYIDYIQVPNLKQYWNLFEAEKEKIISINEDLIRPVIYEELIKKDKGTIPYDFTSINKDELSFNHFEPNMMFFYPNNSNLFYEDEPMWIIPGLNFDYLWDFSLSQEQNVCKII